MIQNTPSPEKTGTRWFYTDAQNQAVGPVSFDDLNKMAAAGIVMPETLVIAEGGTEWQPYRTMAVPPRPPVPPPPVEPHSPPPAKVRRWPAVLSVLLLYPIGLIVLWLNKGYTTKIKILITAVSGLLFFAAISTGHAGLILLAIVFNGVVFIWTAESMTRGPKIALAVVLGVITLPALFVKPEAGHTGAPVVSTSTGKTDENNPPSESSAADAPPVVERNQSFRLGDFTYKIQSGQMVESVGGRFTRVTPTPGGVFYIVSYQITNESKRTKTVLSDDFVLRDAEGREFSPSSKAVTALAMSQETKDFIVSE